MRTRRFALLAVGRRDALGFFLYGPTFSGGSYAYDDVDYLNQAADVLAGRAPFWRVLFRPQGEHFVPVLRLLLTASASLFGTNATPLRLLVFAAHVLSALFLALTARRLLKDDVAGLFGRDPLRPALRLLLDVALVSRVAAASRSASRA